MIYSPFVLPLLAAAVTAVASALGAARQRRYAGASALTALMWSAAVWSAFYALEIADASLPAKLWWAKIQYVGIASMPAAWLVFAVRYSGREKWLTSRNLVLLCAIPALTFALALTNEWHHLIWTEVGAPAGPDAPWLVLAHGAWFWLHVAYTYLCLAAGSVMLVPMLVQSQQVYRWQVLLALCGVAAPWVGNALYLAGVSALDLSPIAITVSGLLLVVARLRFRLFDIVPVARDRVIAGMGDGLIVLDAYDRVVDMNPAAERIAGVPASRGVGQLAAAVLGAHWPELSAGVGDYEVTVPQASGAREYELHVSWLGGDRGRPVGRLLVWHDITERKRVERELSTARALAEERSRAAEEARAAAEGANRAKTVFLANMSHNLRTPLHAILGFSDLMLREEKTGLASLAPQQRENLAAIARNGRELLELINEVLEFTRSEGEALAASSIPGDEVLVRAEQPVVDADELRARLSKLSPTWRADLYQATVEGDREQMLHFVRGAQDADPVLADNLTRLIERFDHREILRLIEELDAG